MNLFGPHQPTLPIMDYFMFEGQTPTTLYCIWTSPLINERELNGPFSQGETKVGKLI